MRSPPPQEFDRHYVDLWVVEQGTAELEAGTVTINVDAVLMVWYPVVSWAWTLGRASQHGQS